MASNATIWSSDVNKKLVPIRQDIGLKSSALKGLLGDRVWSHVPVGDFSGEGKIVGLYFASGDCDECCHFTPTLINFYNKIHTRYSTNEEKEEQKKLEIVYISCDPDTKTFEDFYKDMPWPALPLNEPDRERIMKKYDVKGLPAVVFIDGATGEEVLRNGCQQVSQDPDGERFPKRWNR